jgi:SAM-dependent methyltransferase
MERTGIEPVTSDLQIPGFEPRLGQIRSVNAMLRWLGEVEIGYSGTRFGTRFWCVSATTIARPGDRTLARTSAIYRRWVADEAFQHPRLAAIYDALDSDRSDLDVYVAIAAELDATRVLDIGCGTGTFSLLLAERGYEVTGVDPARASLDVARGKPGAERVRWIEGDATRLPPLRADLATMTGNVAQAIADEVDWHGTLRGTREALRPGGHFVFETRKPDYRAWEEWNRRDSQGVTEIAGVGAVESRVDLLEITGPLVSFRWTYVFPDGDVLTSDSTLRFREREEVEEALISHGYVVDEVRDAPDRPGREFVFFARRA